MKTVLILFLLCSTITVTHADQQKESPQTAVLGANALSTSVNTTTSRNADNVNHSDDIICRAEFVQIEQQASGHTDWTLLYFAQREMESWSQSIGTIYKTVSLVCKKASPNDNKE